MHIRCGGIFNKYFIANFLENLSVKNFENRLKFDEVTAMCLVSPFLWDFNLPHLYLAPHRG